MRRNTLILTLILAVTWMACEDDSMDPPAPNDDVPVVDLSSFAGCWHVTSIVDPLRSGPPRCRAALDSVLDLLAIRSADSLFAAIDTVTHLTFVAPYRGDGDFDGTQVQGNKGSVTAVYRHGAGTCLLVTKISGVLLAEEEDTEFQAFYTVKVHFEGEDSCATGDCQGLIAFAGVRRPDARCEGP